MLFSRRQNSQSAYELLSTTDSDFDEPPYTQRPSQSSYRHYLRRTQRLLSPRRLPFTLLGALFVLVIFTALFNPSYTSPPAFSIPEDERVFIAANIVNDELVRGVWGQAIIDLVELIGPEKAYVSVYGGPTEALQEFRKQLRCNSSIVSEAIEPLDPNTIPHVILPSGEERIKRISYLAEVRNRALLPLDSLDARFDKILFLNDVVFDPEEATRLLFATNAVSEFEDGSGRITTNYRAACAMDYISPFKFYDTFATRDLGGYGIGVPFFPYFADVGEAESRKDIIAGKDAVRVKSCWGGMVAFDARFFQKRLPKSDDEAGEWRGAKAPVIKEKETEHMGISIPVKFRSEESTFWDASECCLIHADIQGPLAGSGDNNTGPEDVGIFVNPYVRVAYDIQTFSWLPSVKRIERLFSTIHNFVNWLASMPHNNPRRGEIPGTKVRELKWVYDDIKNWQKDKDILKGGEAARIKGNYKFVNRIAGKGGFCGGRQLLVMKEGELEPGERNWEKLPIPPE